MRKIPLILLIILSLSPITQATYNSDYYNLSSEEPLYRDIDENHENFLALRYLTKEGVIEGYYDGYYRPDEPILRAELVKMLMDIYHNQYTDQDEFSCFPDTPNFEWYTKRICRAKALGFVHGYEHDGKFHPEWNASRAEGAKIILNTLGVTPTNYDSQSPSPWLDLEGNEWFYSFAKVIEEKNLMPEDWNTFYPDWELTRGLAAEIIFRSIIMIETGMDRFDPEAISTFEFGGHDDGIYTVKTVNTDDSIILNNGEEVLLIGVDRPEIYAVDCYADEAYAYAKKQLLGKEVELKKDPFGDDRNAHGQLLRYVYFKGEHNFSFNYQILYDGFAYVEENYLYQFYYDLRNAMDSGYSTGRGLWSVDACRGSSRSLMELGNYPTDSIDD